jgi:hypothetical protein
MIICDTSNIDIIQGIIGYGNISEGMTDWRIENTSNGIFNILNSSSIIQPFGGISEIGEISGSTDRYMIFTDGTSTFTVPSGGINCDILIVGGGGGGGDPHGGGGGAGQLVFIHQATLNGEYTVKVGKGGTGGVFSTTPPTKGTNSEFGNISTTVIAEGGGANTNTIIDKNGGSGAGGDGYTINGGTAGPGNAITTTDLFPNATVYTRGNNGGDASGGAAGGGGGAGEVGQSGSFTIQGKGGDGLSGITDINYDFQANFGNFGRLEADGKYYFAGGGGGGATTQLNGGKGGGGAGGKSTGAIPNNLGGNAIANTGSGGGGGGGNGDAVGGAGGSGIVIIRYSIQNISIPNISIIDNGNVGIGITPVTNSSLLEVAGDVNIIGNYKRNNRDIILDTSNYVLLTSNILTNYYNSNKPIGGNGINISETLPPVISSTQWTMSGNNIYSTTAISIGTVVNYSKLTLSNGSVGTTGITCRPLKICAGANTNAGNETATFIGLGTGGGIVKCGIGHCRTNFYDKGSIVFACNNVASGVEFTMADEAMRITSNGRVGIGLTNPAANIHVAAGTGVQSGFATYFNFGYTTFGSGSSGNASVAVKVTGSVWATDSVLSTSDIRIKNDIQDIIDDSALQIILAIEPKTYKYIDKIDRFDKRVYGFIAQQIRDVIPGAVNIQLSYIPNIMLLANYNNNIITFSSQPNYVIKYNDKIKCYDKNNKEIFVIVEEIINVLTFRIKELDNVYTDTNIFVYGCEVEDFHTLDKTYIYTLNVCATQELNRRIEAQNAIIQSQEESIKELETMVSLLLNNNST